MSILQQLDQRPVDRVEDNAVRRELSKLGLQQGQANSVDSLLPGDHDAAGGSVELSGGDDAADVGTGAIAEEQLRLFGQLETVVAARVDEAFQGWGVVEDLAACLE
ncbi:hypothetical protein D3C79_950230 [compost metagenome]